MLLGPDAKHHLEHLALRNLYHGHLDMFRDEDLTMVKKSKIFQKVHAGYSVSKTNSIVSCTRFITSQTNQLINAVPIYLLSSLHGPFSAEQVLSVMMQVENWNQNYSSTFPTTDVFCFYEYEDSCHVVFDQLFGWTYQPICSTRFASPLSCEGEMGKGAHVTRAPAMKRNLVSFAKSRMPNLETIPDDNHRSFKEAKRVSILAGLRVMKAPAVFCLKGFCFEHLGLPS